MLPIFANISSLYVRTATVSSAQMFETSFLPTSPVYMWGPLQLPQLKCSRHHFNQHLQFICGDHYNFLSSNVRDIISINIFSLYVGTATTSSAQMFETSFQWKFTHVTYFCQHLQFICGDRHNFLSSNVRDIISMKIRSCYLFLPTSSVYMWGPLQLPQLKCSRHHFNGNSLMLPIFANISSLYVRTATTSSAQMFETSFQR